MSRIKRHSCSCSRHVPTTAAITAPANQRRNKLERSKAKTAKPELKFLHTQLIYFIFILNSLLTSYQPQTDINNRGRSCIRLGSQAYWGHSGWRWSVHLQSRPPCPEAHLQLLWPRAYCYSNSTARPACRFPSDSTNLYPKYYCSS